MSWNGHNGLFNRYGIWNIYLNTSKCQYPHWSNQAPNQVPDTGAKLARMVLCDNALLMAQLRSWVPACAPISDNESLSASIWKNEIRVSPVCAFLAVSEDSV